MAWIEKRPGGWIGRYRVDGRTKSTTVFKRKKDATEAADAAERQGKLGQYVDRKRGSVMVRQFSETWLESLHVTPKTRHTYRELLDSLILPRWGSVSLNQVTLTDVKRWVATMVGPRGEVGATRKRSAAAQLVRMLDAAVDERLIHINPARTASGKANYLPSAKRHKTHRYLTHGELEALAEQCGEYGTLVRLAGLTGLRWGEITALRVSDIDSVRCRVNVARAYSMVGGKKVLGATKTHEIRALTYPRSLGVDLEEAVRGKAADDLLFSTRTGAPLDNANFSKQVLGPAWMAAGIDRLTFHDLRHTAASLAVQAGGNVKTVQNMLGHASATMTLDTYAGLFDTDAQELADRMDTARAEALDEQSKRMNRPSAAGATMGA